MKVIVQNTVKYAKEKEINDWFKINCNREFPVEMNMGSETHYVFKNNQVYSDFNNFINSLMH